MTSFYNQENGGPEVQQLAPFPTLFSGKFIYAMQRIIGKKKVKNPTHRIQL